MYEHGLQERENIKYYTKKPQCAGTGGKFISVSIIDVEPAIVLLCWGFGISFAVFVIERSIKTLYQKLLLKIDNHMHLQ